MPYNSVSDLPPQVSSLPSHAKHVWLAAFNSAHKQYPSEQQAFQVAWAAVRKAGYHKDAEGNWVKSTSEG